jgi:hypothetical protein
VKARWAGLSTYMAVAALKRRIIDLPGYVAPLKRRIVNLPDRGGTEEKLIRLWRPWRAGYQPSWLWRHWRAGLSASLFVWLHWWAGLTTYLAVKTREHAYLAVKTREHA